MMELTKCVYKTKYSKYKNTKRYDKRKTKNVRIYVINTGSNNKAIPKTICIAFRCDEAPVHLRA